MLLQLHYRLSVSLESQSIISTLKVSLEDPCTYREGVVAEPDIFRQF